MDIAENADRILYTLHTNRQWIEPEEYKHNRTKSMKPHVVDLAYQYAVYSVCT